jgi:hypothetical protein
MSEMSNTILEGDYQRIISAIWLRLTQRRLFLNLHPPFYIFSLAAILVENWDHRTHFWKGATQGSFCQSLFAISPVVSEEKIKM